MMRKRLLLCALLAVSLDAACQFAENFTFEYEPSGQGQFFVAGKNDQTIARCDLVPGKAYEVTNCTLKPGVKMDDVINAMIVATQARVKSDEDRYNRLENAVRKYMDAMDAIYQYRPKGKKPTQEPRP